MSANLKEHPRHYFSLDEYFALEDASDARFEYWDGDIVCMSGGSRAHGQISSNVHFQLRLKLRGGPRRAFTADQAVRTPTLLPYCYPDVSVGYGQLSYVHIHNVDALTNPVLIVEVLSPTTADHDREEKFAAYQAIPSFSEYLLMAQDAPHVTHYVRRLDGRWAREDVTNLDAAVTLESVGCTLPLREVYEDVTFKRD
jgi:Uma2 family endonuclease